MLIIDVTTEEAFGILHSVKVMVSTRTQCPARRFQTMCARGHVVLRGSAPLRVRSST